MVIGGGADGYNNYTQRGSFHHIEETVRALIETFPMIARLKMLRQWGGIVDVTGDRSPILSKTPVDGVFVNCGWGAGGFKANSACFAFARASLSTKASLRGWRIELRRCRISPGSYDPEIFRENRLER